ncbi:MAG TPA: flagellar basal body protein [Burkholderiaceae bacterium]|nr:flagellar basal body protein [Burkholderiaceae bacterium]
MLDRLTSNLRFHGEALTLRSERQQVLASNLANADTPNYQARDFDFGQALRSAVAGLGAGTLAMAPSAGQRSSATLLPAGTLSLSSSSAGTSLRTPQQAGGDTRLLWRTPEQPSIDGNTVDLDRERASFADNSLRYEATLRFINGSVRNTLSAIRGD